MTRCGARALGAVASFFAIGACSIDVSLDGRGCPCIEGYLCDRSANVCVADACKVSAKRFDKLWATPHGIAFTLPAVGAADGFLRYEVVIGTSKQDVESRSGSARVLTDADHPELAEMTGPGTQRVVVLEGGLTPSTTYYAALQSVDTSGCESRSEVIAVPTPPESVNQPIWIFDPANPGTPSFQPSSVRLSTNGSETEVTYVLAEYVCCVMECDASGEPIGGGSSGGETRFECGQPLKLDRRLTLGSDGGQANLVRGDTFDDAYVEVDLFFESTLPARIGIVWLDFDDGTELNDIGESIAKESYRFDELTFIPTTGFRTVEVPLSALARNGVALEHADLLTPSTQFALGGQWNRDATVHVRSVRIFH
ncbi:MAG: hypothetical protein JNL21_16750 [Myxococcales bacterium]|nr:hypothetical protein [Myxococcales bacterium]